jgi:hypothetical protein
VRDQELDGFVKRINLINYLVSLGYELDPKEKAGAVKVLRCGSDKIHVRLMPNGDWAWHSFRDDHGGSIIDFVMRRQGIQNLGEVRKRLRPWIGRPVPEALPAVPHRIVVRDRSHLQSALAEMAVALRHAYLENVRGIPADLLGCPRIAGQVRIDRCGNAIFPHCDETGGCGFEIRGPRFKGFSAGGKKALWMSHQYPIDRALVFCESGIDALSYAALFPSNHSRYASIAGRPSVNQRALICSAIVNMPANSEIVAAMDADAGGRDRAKDIRAAFDLACRADLVFREHYPEESGDWNDELCRVRCRRAG